MAQRYDGVVETVRYTPEGQIALVRVYERRGPAFSDRILLDRLTLIKRIKEGKRFVVGERQPYLAGTFKVGDPIRLAGARGSEMLLTGSLPGSHDLLNGVPLF
jgi:hypothetical protein